jgi:hypothetical protein
VHRRLLQVMMLLTLLISRKILFGENLSFALGLPVVESKDVSWISELAYAPGRLCTRLIRLEVSPPLRPPPCGD